MEERKEAKEASLTEILLETQKEYTRSNKMKDKIIILLIVCMLLEALSFVWYESQFEVATGVTTTYEMSTEGDNASIEKNDVSGNLFQDNSVNNDMRNGGES